jgi:hypothetical protein
VLLLAGASQAQAAWDNVFQVTCFGCKPKPSPAVAQYYAPSPCCPQPCPAPCPPPCTTTYQLRSYYQPVTTYRTSYYLEPVTTYRTSYYYEPVTTYRYSCYYDPCSCSYQQRAVPCTSYQLRSQCCPVTSYLQRCQLVPETTNQLRYYYEPVTTCASPCATSPGVNENRSSPPSVNENRDRLPPGESSRKFDVPDNGYRQPGLQPPVPVQNGSRETSPPPQVRLDKIVLLDEPTVEGQVVQDDKKPQAGARVVFVSQDQLGAKQTVTADAHGQFKVNLASGAWLVYVHDEKGNAVFKEKVEVKENQPARIVLTSR